MESTQVLSNDFGTTIFSDGTIPQETIQQTIANPLAGVADAPQASIPNIKRGRGRPRKNPQANQSQSSKVIPPQTVQVDMSRDMLLTIASLHNMTLRALSLKPELSQTEIGAIADALGPVVQKYAGSFSYFEEVNLAVAIATPIFMRYFFAAGEPQKMNLTPEKTEAEKNAVGDLRKAQNRQNPSGEDMLLLS